MAALSSGKPVYNKIAGVFNPHLNDFVWLSINATPIFRQGNAKPYQVFVTLHDISESRHLEENLKFLSLHDPLTGLYNRNELENILVRELHRASRYHHDLSVFMLDIDHFKEINDTYGHSTGDKVLCRIALFVSRGNSGGCYGGRFGGEEFVIVLPETSAPRAKELAIRLCNNIAAHSVKNESGEEIKMTVSIGVASFSENANTPGRILQTADSAMYMAKKAGRNQVRSP